MKYLLFIVLLPICLICHGQDSENYILSIRPRVGLAEITVGSNLSTDLFSHEAQLRVDYYDGLGRPVQHIEKGASPLGKDIITLRKYNDYGKEHRFILPYPHASQSNGHRIHYVTTRSGSSLLFIRLRRWVLSS